jgi:hypothetical protein
MQFLTLNALDGITTWLVMRPDYYNREANPLGSLAVYSSSASPAGL